MLSVSWHGLWTLELPYLESNIHVWDKRMISIRLRSIFIAQFSWYCVSLQISPPFHALWGARRMGKGNRVWRKGDPLNTHSHSHSLSYSFTYCFAFLLTRLSILQIAPKGRDPSFLLISYWEWVHVVDLLHFYSSLSFSLFSSPSLWIAIRIFFSHVQLLPMALKSAPFLFSINVSRFADCTMQRIILWSSQWKKVEWSWEDWEYRRLGEFEMWVYDSVGFFWLLSHFHDLSSDERAFWT